MYEESYDGESFDGDNFEGNQEANFSNFSGTNSIFNQSLAKGKQRGLYQSKNRKNSATVQFTVENFTGRDQIFELFNSNNSIAVQTDDALYAGKGDNGNQAWQPVDAKCLYDLVGVDGGDPSLTPIAAITRTGELAYIDTLRADGITTNSNTDVSIALGGSGALAANLRTAVLVSLKSTLQGNTYRRFIEKMKYSVIHVKFWKMQCSNEEQFQLPIAQKDFGITGASTDDEYQVSGSVSSKDNNTKIVEINDKMLLIDGDTRLTGVILPHTKLTFTFEIDIINEITKAVFR